jgi:hypothetical protein
MPFPFMAAASLGIGALGGLFGRKKRPKPQDLQTYAYDKDQRKALAGSNFGMLQRMSGADPSLSGGANVTNHPYWGGQGAWTTSRDISPSGQVLGASIMGGGMDANGNIQRRGGGSASHAGAGRVDPAQAALNLSDLDLNAEIYGLDLPEKQRQRLMSKGNEYFGAQTNDQVRQMNEAMTAGANSGSPAAIAAQAGLRRQQLKGQADMMRDVESDWFTQAGARQAAARSQRADITSNTGMFNAGQSNQVNTANEDRASNVGMFNAGADNSMSMFNSQLDDAAADRSQRGGMFLAGLRGEDEDRMIRRYGGLNDMNFQALSPTGNLTQMEPEQSKLGAMFGGMGAGMNLFSGLGGSSGIKGMFGMGGGGGGGFGAGGFGSGYGSGFASQFGMPGRFGR